MFSKLNQKRIARKSKTKELKPKDGYNRFKFRGKIFRYKKENITEIEHDFSGQSVPMGKTYAWDNDGNIYVIEFAFIKKWVPFSISEPKKIY